MKKLLVVLLVLVAIFAFTACGNDTNSFTELSGNQTIFVGNSNSFTNIHDEYTENQYLEYVAYRKYTLNRSTYDYNGNGVLIGDYYYYWSIQNTYDDLYLGTKTTKTSIEYSYLPYGEEQCNILIKSIQTTSYEFSYESEIIETSFDYSFELNNYFTSFTALKTASSELAALADISSKTKHYVDADEPVTTYRNVQTYTNTFYYFENNEA